MKIAVLSGKGGTGKTFVSVNLARAIGKSMYLDCDVEEPNGHIFLKPKNIKEKIITKLLPRFDASKCTKCRKCVELCRFNALAFVGEKPMVFEDVCHSCGVCKLACEYGAVEEVSVETGKVEHGTCGDIDVVTGRLNLGEASGVGTIDGVLDEIDEKDAIIDCPPGSGCAVMESIERADYCIIVGEPTRFGLHNFKMVYELATLMNKKIGVILNKVDDNAKDFKNYLKTNNIDLIAEIPYSKELAKSTSQGEIAYEVNEEAKKIFDNILNKLRKEVTQ